ncbi:glutamate decarboxylase gad1 [Tieghemiomyces parasiticus]|uniref:Glutamate decarboxylase n=1 Tax=Tieghemiomyces parasiticus TaxID=78921 RepID=A0A9W8AET0_9FUNG|nr:glutamate decarboxylase gad1 [Tieghemiomyces parasiticus]
MLVQQIDVEKILDLARNKVPVRDDVDMHSLKYGSRYSTADIPKFTFPERSSPADVTYQLVHDELEFDGKPLMNCASFVSTWMEPQADKLIMENINKNLADQDEYPAAQVVHGRCVSYLADLWKAPKDGNAVGTATGGSSEAIMLGGLALKWRWREARQKEGKDTSKPNIIMGANAQVALEKFARYFDVEARLIPVKCETNFTIDPEEAIKHIDENTIGMFIILGSTYTGHFEPVHQLSQMLDEVERRTGINVPIHVDAASGGFVAPFLYPDLPWSFEVPRVVSINGSGHKFGLSYAGVGWVLWRDAAYLPRGLVFELHYLGGAEETYTLNFSRPACFVVTQYYNFIRLGREGYKRIHTDSLSNARLLSRSLEATGVFELLSDIHRSRGETYHGLLKQAREAGKGQSVNDIQSLGGEFQAGQQGSVDGVDGELVFYNAGLPVVTFKFTDAFQKEYPTVTQAAISLLLRVKGWIVPNYELPPSCETVEILRVVVRESMSADLVDRFMHDTVWALKLLTEQSGVGASILASQDQQVLGNHTPTFFTQNGQPFEAGAMKKPVPVQVNAATEDEACAVKPTEEEKRSSDPHRKKWNPKLDRGHVGLNAGGEHGYRKAKYQQKKERQRQGEEKTTVQSTYARPC